MEKKVYLAPWIKTICFSSGHSFMKGTDWAETKRGRYYDYEDDEWDNSTNTWGYKHVRY